MRKTLAVLAILIAASFGCASSALALIPTITSFTPTSLGAGTKVTITGTNLTGATSVKFNNVSGTSVTVLSATSVTAIAPKTTTGKIKVTTLGGTATSAASFTFIPVPTITSFTPTSGKTGVKVTITGTNLTGATSVKFNGVAGTTVTVVSPTTITAFVPDTSTGVITITTQGGTATSPKSFIVPIVASQMIAIPAGSFEMGNNGNEPFTPFNELPKRTVTLAAYSISKYEVTRGWYRQFINAGGYSKQSLWSAAGWSWKVNYSRTQPQFWTATQSWTPGQSFTQTDDHPVVGVTYYEAEAFCKWAGGHLPTEAQWERAARWTGTAANVYPWGNVWDVEKFNNFYDHNPAGGGFQRYQTAPVGSYIASASPVGCQDMAGNVWEWTQDWYKSYPSSATPLDYTNTYRTMRGGGWGSVDSYYRCAARFYSNPSYAYYHLGFRLAK